MEIAYVGRVAVVGNRYFASFSDLSGCIPEAGSFIELETVAVRVVEDYVRDHFLQFQRLPERYFVPPREGSSDILRIFVDLDYLLA